MKNILFSTSMNIDNTLMEQLDEICKRYGISRSDLTTSAKEFPLL